MERGFKARCEEMSRSLRIELGIASSAPLPAEELASFLEVRVLQVTELGLSPDDTRQLLHHDPESWSAITVSSAGKDAIIVNPNHHGGRYSSDVMHELAHLLLGHESSTLFFAGQEDLALRGYNKEAEDEANWLAGALLLPRDALVSIRKRRYSKELACTDYGVSRQMLDYRMRMTGVERQFSKGKKSNFKQ